MPKDATYHESAIRYNQEIAQFAEDLAPTLEDEEVQRWSRAVAKQHRFHEGRHKKALNKLFSMDQDPIDPEARPTPGPVMDETDIVDSVADTQTIQDVQASYAEGFGQEQYRDSVPTDVETPELDAEIDALHGEGAAEALEKAFEDGSVFGEATMDNEVGAEEKIETELCEGGFPESMPVNAETGRCNSDSCTGGHPIAVEEKE